MLDARRVLWGAMLLGLWVRAGHAVEAQVTLGGKPATVSASACGFSVAYLPGGPQVAVTNQYIVMSLRKGEEATIILPVEGVADNSSIMATASLIEGRAAEVSLSPEGGPASRAVLAEGHTSVELRGKGAATVRLVTRATRGAASVRWRKIRLGKGADSRAISVKLSSPVLGAGPPPALPPLHPEIENALIEWDWRMQDGIGTPRAPSTYDAATQRIVQSIDGLIRARQADGVDVAREKTWLDAVRWVSKEGGDAETAWRIMHTLRRRLVLRNPLLTDLGPLLFVKQVPGCFSHQLTQYYGRYARPGGGLFVLEKPGQSMACRQLAPGALPEGSVMHPEVSTDGRRILFAYCQAETTPRDPIRGHAGRYYHLYEVAGEGVRRLTDGDFDDFSPKILPNGKIVFVSTRRLGWHRCGSPGCENYTLAMANADGSNPHPISFHETQEWDPAVLNDGRIIYTRWDYVDRHAVYYEQLWTVRADGSAPVAFYGNNTFNPVGTWEARPVPGSRRVMATAAAHHAMTAGSIVLIDVAKGVDGLEPITRLTPDVPFPESEAPVLPRWRATAGNPRYPTPIEAQRWPGHCYRSPYPLSERCFLVAYSYDALIGEPKGNPANMFGIYLVDGLGNKELLYRDPNIASLWPIPLRPRPRPFDMAPATEHIEAGDGVFLLQDVYASEPRLARGSVKRLRIVQVLPKSTPGINRPAVGVANGSPGKQVLGTVPVAEDGSAHFRAPAGIPLSFQALDERGQAVQVMRSITYLQPGEVAACIGCHEPRTIAPPERSTAQALRREPSAIEPGPDGSKPLSYPILVQPVLDRLCVSCHNPKKPDGKVILTGEPQGHYTFSYNALAPRVSYAAWGGKPGDFRVSNSEPISKPGFFGARGSRLMKLLLDGHYKVKLSPSDMERLVTWMDANALFYGTFQPEDQARQRRGERIAGPGLE